jgi:hypothetical protein
MKEKIIKKLFTLFFVALLSASCSTLKKVNCYSTKFVNVTFITKSGFSYTLAVPYCDTIKLDNDKVPDSVKAILKGY